MNKQDKHRNLPNVEQIRKRLEAAFDGIILTSKGGAPLLRWTEVRCAVTTRIETAIPDTSVIGPDVVPRLQGQPLPAVPPFRRIRNPAYPFHLAESGSLDRIWIYRSILYQLGKAVP